MKMSASTTPDVSGPAHNLVPPAPRGRANSARLLRDDHRLMRADPGPTGTRAIVRSRQHRHGGLPDNVELGTAGCRPGGASEDLVAWEIPPSLRTLAALTEQSSTVTRCSYAVEAVALTGEPIGAVQ